jgi:hypothetical protein
MTASRIPWPPNDTLGGLRPPRRTLSHALCRASTCTAVPSTSTITRPAATSPLISLMNRRTMPGYRRYLLRGGPTFGPATERGLAKTVRHASVGEAGLPDCRFYQLRQSGQRLARESVIR